MPATSPATDVVAARLVTTTLGARPSQGPCLGGAHRSLLGAASSSAAAASRVWM